MKLRIVAFTLTLVVCSSGAISAELEASDAGVYAVVGRDGLPTSLLYRFTIEAGAWRAEGKDGNGPWKDISCDRGCQYAAATQSQALAYLPPTMRQTYLISCVQNVAQAFCKYTSKENASQRGYVVMGLVTNPPVPIHVRRQR